MFLFLSLFLHHGKGELPKLRDRGLSWDHLIFCPRDVYHKWAHNYAHAHMYTYAYKSRYQTNIDVFLQWSWTWNAKVHKY